MSQPNNNVTSPIQPIDESASTQGPPVEIQEQAPSDTHMHDVDSNSGDPTTIARQAIDAASQNVMYWAIQLACPNLSVQDQQGALNRHELALRMLNSLVDGFDSIKKTTQPDPVVSAKPAKMGHVVVPVDLPLLQWSGNVFDRSKTVFGSVQECLNRFEDIVESYSQDLDAAWCRLLP